MGNIMISIKRFLKNKNTVTIIAILASLGILYWAYYYRIQKATEPVNVPYATQIIEPRNLITKEMVSIRKVPGGVVSPNVYRNTTEIIGKYVINTAVVPENGLFYKDMIVNWEDIPSSEFEDIPDCETVYQLKVNIDSTFGNSIFKGNYIDLYYRNTVSENGISKVKFGKFIESIKVLSVVDDKGSNVFETSGSPKSPSYLYFSVRDKYFRLLKIAERSGGEIIPVQRNSSYSTNAKPTAIASSEIENYIRSFAVSDEELRIDNDVCGGTTDNSKSVTDYSAPVNNNTTNQQNKNDQLNEANQSTSSNDNENKTIENNQNETGGEE